MSAFFKKIYIWIDYNTGDFSELIYAFPLIVFIGLMYSIFRLLYIKRRSGDNFNKNQIKKANELIRMLFILWYTSLCFMTLFPTHFWQALWSSCLFEMNIFHEMRTIRFSGWDFVPDIISYIADGHLNWFFPSLRFKTTDYIENVLLFVPLGIMLPLSFKKQSFIRVILTGMCSSFLIEFVQGFIGRDGDIDDLIFNTLGTAIGFLLYLFVKKMFPKFTRKCQTFSLSDNF